MISVFGLEIRSESGDLDGKENFQKGAILGLRGGGPELQLYNFITEGCLCYKVAPASAGREGIGRGEVSKVKGFTFPIGDRGLPSTDPKPSGTVR